MFRRLFGEMLRLGKNAFAGRNVKFLKKVGFWSDSKSITCSWGVVGFSLQWRDARCFVSNMQRKLENLQFCHRILFFEKNSYIFWNPPITVGSKSTITARGTWRPLPVSEKNVENDSSPADGASDGIRPSGWIPCSKQYNSQQAFPIWTPAWPTWMLITSR